MKLNPIKIAYDALPQSIKNTSALYIEGTRILVNCVARNSKRSDEEVIEWLLKNDIKLEGINQILKKDGTNRSE